MASVFDVASELLQRSGGQMETVKLQKLCFYTFGWYAHLTAEPAFGEQFYAMEKGPVVGELLSAHAGQKEVTFVMIATQRSEREEGAEGIDPYLEAVIDSVWAAYGDMSSWALVDKTHEEAVWKEAWTTRRRTSRRGDLPHEELVDYFFSSRTPEKSIRTVLPDSQITRALVTDLEKVESCSGAHSTFVDAVRSFHWAA